MNEVSQGGRTVLFVSHNTVAVTRLCKSGIWLDTGQVCASGNTEEVVARYLASGVEKVTAKGEVTFSDDEHAPGSEFIRLLAVSIRNNQGEVANSLDGQLPFTIEVDYRVLSLVSNLRVGLSLKTYDGLTILTCADMERSKEQLVRTPGIYRSKCQIPGEFLNSGEYYVSIGSDFHMVKTHFFLDRLLAFRIEQTGGGRGELLRLSLPWAIQKLD